MTFDVKKVKRSKNIFIQPTTATSFSNLNKRSDCSAFIKPFAPKILLLSDSDTDNHLKR